VATADYRSTHRDLSFAAAYRTAPPLARGAAVAAPAARARPARPARQAPAARPAPRAHPALDPPIDQAGVVLWIESPRGRDRYLMTAIAADPGSDCTALYALTKIGPDDRAGPEPPHYVAQTWDGPTCDCGDYQFRREGIDPKGCKHIQALTLSGFLCGAPREGRPS
jgi:hypothetical protein